MAAKKCEMIVYCAANMVDDDTSTVGGAIDKTARPIFAQLQVSSPDTIKVKSENTGDTTQAVTVYGNREAGADINEEIDLTGQSWAAGSLEFAQINRVTIDGAHAGAIAVVSDAAVNSGTAQGGGEDYITLAAAASAVNNYYFNMVVILDDHQIRRIIRYDGTTKRAYVWPWTGSDPTGSTTYNVHEGVFLDKVPNEVTEVVSVFRAIGSPDSEEPDPIVLYGKCFHCNGSGESKDFTNVRISETDDTVASGTAQGGGDNYITLAADDTGGDDDYKNMFVKITAGTGSGQVRQVTSNTASNKRCYVRGWDTNPDGTSQYQICKSLRDKVEFALEDAVDDNGTATNRLTVPTGVSAFNDSEKTVPDGGTLEVDEAIGIWLKLTLNPGDLPAVSHYPTTTKWLSN
jgi:hypothetical protein